MEARCRVVASWLAALNGVNGVMNKTQLHNGHVLVEKPWGQYTDIYRSASTVFKRLDIKPGEEISYQYHNYRDECWYITAGLGHLKVDGEELLACAGDTFYIEKGVSHQISNTGNLMLTIFEMQCGDCREDDIVRLSDKYDRKI